MRKSLISTILMFLIISLMAGYAFADSGIIINNGVDNPLVNIGDNVTFMVNLTNNGSLNYTNVQIQALLSPGLQYISSSGTYSNATGIWNVGNLKSGVSKQLYITVNVLDALKGQMVDFKSSLFYNDQNATANNGLVSLTISNNSTSNNTNNTTNNTNASNTSNIILNSIVDKSTVNPGDLINFTVSIKNNGTKDLSALQIQALLPPGLEYVSHGNNITNNNYTDGIWYLGNLRAGNQKYLNITARVSLNLSGQQTNLNFKLMPNVQNATVADSLVNLSISNNTAGILNNNTTSSLVEPKDSAWKSDLLDNGSSYTSLVMDSLGNHHLIYTQLPVLKYIYKTENGWINETIANNTTSRGTGFYPDLALDSSNNPHVVYNDGNTALKYAYKDNSGWHFENIFSGDVSYTNIIMNNNSPCISFFDNGAETVKYAYKNGTSWVVESVAKSAGHYNSLILDSTGNPRIAYHDDYYGDLRYAMRIGPNDWKNVIVDNSTHVGSWNSLTLNSQGNPQISYILQDGGLKYAQWNGINWIYEILDNSTAQGTNMVLDYTGNPQIAYLDTINQVLKLAYKDQNSSAWNIQNINITSGVSPWISLAMDSLGVPQIAYSNGNGYLNYAYLNPIAAKINSTPESGSYKSPVSLILTPDKNGTIYYTTDGSDPRNSSSRLEYVGPVNVSTEGNTIVKFAAIGNYSYWKNVWSDVYTKNYTLDTHAPSVASDVPSGNYNTYKYVKITSSDSSTIYYTTDGSNPVTSPTKIKYTSAIKISKQGTNSLKYSAVDSVGNWAAVNTKTYQLAFPTASLTVSNKGTGKISLIYYLTVQLPDNQKQYKKFSTTLYPNKAYVLNLGKYPVGTKFTFAKFIYNKSPYRKTINVYNKLTMTGKTAFTQRIYLTKVYPSKRVYSSILMEMSSTGIKAKVLQVPVRK
ncbi:MAG: chitobiase/beta-hexosaminidase C-terminal domain-containing protein [Methanobacteriaceae archaeon]|nr:chitobiase/beta-hexosaminidase C-terminal domain-containing protein [Methanobacteriaceae archaeon]MDP2836565.1 chitobiase/beta-hexosaminidase C-terminal domain-containing protein [Methanobacteriaceae archaeon]MDP3034918.1 chitobiase/beta-hexosaminidase C-terminal domain-containing protein [Methanobacteriaceae archaeon]MDP3485572.1 chitobiase/beta-hexosaminidase C-terminal domain-containing protein [Methanobacteriaceae archaeon]MDP3624634.1 chitobiase/beta-hexosaminidase C-terminal domain-con